MSPFSALACPNMHGPGIRVEVGNPKVGEFAVASTGCQGCADKSSELGVSSVELASSICRRRTASLFKQVTRRQASSEVILPSRQAILSAALMIVSVQLAEARRVVRHPHPFVGLRNRALPSCPECVPACCDLLQPSPDITSPELRIRSPRASG